MLSKFIDRYKYSSYNNYVETPDFVDTDFCLSMIDLEQFIQFNKEYNDDVCLELEADDYRMTDEEARTIIKKVSKYNTAAEFQLLSIDKRNKFIKILREQGLSIRQISRLTGISFNIVRKF